MFPGQVNHRSRERSLRIFASLSLMAMGCCLLGAGDGVENARPAAPADGGAAAKNANPTTAWLVKVTLPLTGNNESRIRDEIRRRLEKAPKSDSRPILIVEINPGQSQFGQGSEFGKALDLARFLSSREMSTVRTVAYIPKSIKGHGVLLAMACDEIVMAPDAEIGEAGIDEDVIAGVVRSGYTEIADRRKTIPLALALGMLDKQLLVLKIVTDAGTEYILEKDLDDLKKRRTIVAQEEIKPRPGFFAGQIASPAGLGFVSYLCKDRISLAKAFNVSPEAIRERPSGEWRAKKIYIHEPITAKLVDNIKLSIREEVQNGSNLILFDVNSPGGDPAEAQSLAVEIAELDSSKIQTVAYVTQQALSETALIALACDQIVMKQGSFLGGPGSVNLNREQTSDLVLAYRSGIAPKKNRSWSLGAAMVDASIKVFKFTRQGRDEYWSNEELKDQEGAGAGYLQGEEITRPGIMLRLTDGRANELGVAETVRDDTEFRKMIGLERDPPAVEPGWAVTLLRALAAPQLSFLLLAVGFGAFFMELHSPGIGLGGFISFICFLIYFWGRHLNGTAGWLQVLLFVSGVICLLIEIFIIPGAAIFGLGGGLMILASLVLLSQTYIIPRNEYQVEQFRDTLLSIAAAGVFTIGIGAIARRFLQHTPGFNRVLLQPPTEKEREQTARREALTDYSRFMGQTGATATPLAPAGKAQFGNDIVDVMSDGDFVDRGVSVVVIEARGNRIIVRPISSAEN